VSDSLNRAYTDGTYLAKVADWHAADSLWKASQVFTMLERNRLAFDSLYDVGCGAGQVLAELQRRIRRPVKFAGFDISPQAIDIARANAKGSLEFFREDFLTADVAPPDVLLLLDVFEHVPDYLGFLEALRRKAKWIVFHVPLDACITALLQGSEHMLYMRKQYGHLHYFTKETALATLVDTGYEVRDHFYTSDDEISGDTVRRTLVQKLIYHVRKGLFRIRPDLAAACFSRFNLMVLARGDRGATP
jgi:SAM-dependent methyltransferase